MRVPLILYKKSIFANIFSIIGVILVFIGIYALRCQEILAALVYAGAGMLLILLTNMIHDKIEERKIQRLLKDPTTMASISMYSMPAFSLFQNHPKQEVLDFINKYNPYAAAVIVKVLRKEIDMNSAMNVLKEYDAGIKIPPQFVHQKDDTICKESRLKSTFRARDL